ncbi:RWD domain-containing protein 4 [Coccinella septempunctata]|uniref:RWD domain-containing protein 4 n=1 Tax=Coccinella septempunctata TaxID=41139 RepID=UPI001D07E7D4|nr:RWD domain-containing protein 4 [Coccinella septempunctata]
MSNSELQDEEREVLQSIYDGDQQFKEISSKIFQYKYGENESIKSFLLEIEWTENYPEELPKINLDAFYNKHVTPSVKEKIKDLVIEQGNQFLGMSMTYSLFEAVKEKFEELIQEQPDKVDPSSIDRLTISDNVESIQDSKKIPKKEQLTKAQKRRQWNRLDSKGEKPRGWNWVDIVKHLSQTGSKDDKPPTS